MDPLSDFLMDANDDCVHLCMRVVLEDIPVSPTGSKSALMEGPEEPGASIKIVLIDVVAGARVIRLHKGHAGVKFTS